jgi:flagellar export protein FliJ
MKKFKFTLQSVHNVREMREEKELMVLSQLNLEAEQAAERLTAVEGALVTAVEQYNNRIKPGEAINAMEMELNSHHISALRRQKTVAREEVLERQDARARQITQVTQAARDVKVTGRLRDNQVKDHRLAASRHEQNALDEMATISFSHRSGESR